MKTLFLAFMLSTSGFAVNSGSANLSSPQNLQKPDKKCSITIKGTVGGETIEASYEFEAKNCIDGYIKFIKDTAAEHNN